MPGAVPEEQRQLVEAYPSPALLRWGELAALTARRIDLARRRIEVVDAITEVHGRVVVGTTKTHQ